MGQDHDDYADPGGPRRSPLPAVILWVCVGVLLLAIFGPAYFGVLFSGR